MQRVGVESLKCMYCDSIIYSKNQNLWGSIHIVHCKFPILHLLQGMYTEPISYGLSAKPFNWNFLDLAYGPSVWETFVIGLYLSFPGPFFQCTKLDNMRKDVFEFPDIAFNNQKEILFSKNDFWRGMKCGCSISQLEAPRGQSNSSSIVEFRVLK